MGTKLTLNLATPITTLALIGGGEFSFGETREIDELLVRRMPEHRRTVAFLPTASGSAEYALHFGNYLRTIDATVEVINVPVYRGRDARRQKNLDTIAAAGMVYLGGGIASQLLSTIRDSPTDTAMRDAAVGGAVIAAIGAAAACFGSVARDARGSSAIPALGWLNQTAIEPGFDPADDTGLRRLMSVPEIQLGVGIPVSTAIVIDQAGEAEITGRGQIAAFRRQ
jgi:cyanophycinase-like exopeptidase